MPLLKLKINKDIEILQFNKNIIGDEALGTRNLSEFFYSKDPAPD